MADTSHAKTPVLSQKTKLLCFDLESNGLHGQAFAIGAVVMGVDGKIYDSFTARTQIKGEIDEWVEQNVLPAITDMEITHYTYEDFRESFWKWYLAAEGQSDYVIVSNGYPVEYRFLMDCQEADIEQRYWQHPFPLLDLTSLIMPLDISKSDLKTEAVKHIAAFAVHHPLHDALLTAHMAFAALKHCGAIE